MALRWGGNTKSNPQASPRPVQPPGELSQTGGRKACGLLLGCHKTGPGIPSGPMCSSKASGSRLRHGVDDAFGGCPRKNPDIWGCFQGTWDSLGQDASRGNRGPFSTECGFADWSGVTVVRKLGRFGGVGPPAEAGVFTRPPSLVKPELEILKPDAELGFVIWIKCLWVVNGRW